MTANQKSNENSSLSSIVTSSVNDPVLATYAKCLKEDILSSWKRINIKKKNRNRNKQDSSSSSSNNSSNNTDEDDDDEDEDQQQQEMDDQENNANNEANCNNNFDLINNDHLKKELWIFWFEKEEPPNLKSIISPDLYVDNSSLSNNLSFNTNNYGNNNYNSSNNNNNNSSSITQLAISSNNGLPYECRSMLFKALNNLIEKSLIEKGFTRLGKWFVMPYNLNENNKLNEDFEFDNTAMAAAAATGPGATAGLINSKLNSIKLLNGKNEINDNDQNNPQSLPSSNESAACSPMSSNNSNNSKSTTNLNGQGKITNSKQQQQQQLSSLLSTTNTLQPHSTDQFNHVSYSFSFFLHGSSRVCTSVDMKLHKPLRILNTNDLQFLKFKMSQSFSFKNNNNSSHKTTSKQRNQKKKNKFKGLNVILAPYGISARLIGYLSNDSNESKMTCLEWQQFYSLRLYSNLPRILVVGLENNKIKLFYPNSFVFMVVREEKQNRYFNEYQQNTFKMTNLDIDSNELLLGDLHDQSNSASSNSDTENSNSSASLADGSSDNDDTDCDETTDSEEENSEAGDYLDEEADCDDDDDDDENKENLFKNKKNLAKKNRTKANKQQQKLKSSLISPNTASTKNKSKSPKQQLKSSSAAKLGRTNSLGSGIDLINSTKAKDDEKKEMDSLELTIDSVARNFGTNLIKDTDYEETMADDDFEINENDLNEIASSPFPSNKQTSPSIVTATSTVSTGSAQITIKTESTEPLLTQTNELANTAVTSAAPQLKRFKSCLAVTTTTTAVAATTTKTNNLKQKHKSFSAFSNLNLNRNKIIKFNSQDQSIRVNSLSTMTTTTNDKELRTILNNLKTNESQIQLNLFNSSSNRFKKMKNLIKLYLTNKRIEQRINKFKTKRQKSLKFSRKRKDLKKKIAFNKKLNGIKQFRLFVSNYNDSFKDLSYLQKIYRLKRSNQQRIKQLENKNRMSNKCMKCNNLLPNGSTSQQLTKSNQQSNRFLLSSPLKSLSISQNCRCCQFEYSIENQILLKHKQIDLLRENLPLSFDLLDKCQINLSNRFNSDSTAAGTNQRTVNPFKPQNRLAQQQSQCTCCSILTASEELNKTPNKTLKATSNPQAAITSKPSANSADPFLIKQEPLEMKTTNSNENDEPRQPFSNSKQIKLEPFSILKPEITTEIPSSTSTTTQQQQQPPAKPKLNLINVNTQSEPFHHRQCYFSEHVTSNVNTYLQPVVNINKTVYLNKSNKESVKVSAMNQILANKVINLNDDYLLNQNDELTQQQQMQQNENNVECKCNKLSSSSNNIEIKQEIEMDSNSLNLNDDNEENEDEFENDNDYSSDSSSKDLMKEIEKMEKQMAKTNKSKLAFSVSLIKNFINFIIV